MKNEQINQQTPQTAPKKPITKRWWFWVIIAIVVIAVISSNAGNGEPKKEVPNETSGAGEVSSSEDNTFSLNETSGAGEVSSSEDNTFSLNETAVFDNIKITADEIKQSSGESLFQPESGNVFVGVQFTIENISEKDQNISSVLLFDAYADGVKCDYSLEANCVFSDGTLDGTLTPGKKMVGYYSVEIPKDWSELELEVKPQWLSKAKATFVFKQ